MSAHKSVLLEEAIGYLDPKANENFIDCTLGGGGHTKAILERISPSGKVLALDWDKGALKEAKEELSRKFPKDSKRIIFAQGSFAQVREIAKEEKFPLADGMLFDLGLSSDQLERRGRGFSFQRNEPLNMRYDASTPGDASKIVNYSSRQELETILKEYGEERFAPEIAEAIVQYRRQKPITKTHELVRIIQEATPKSYQRQRMHEATKTFQALRIAVNDEVQNLKLALSQARNVLRPGGRVVVISFHSLEDRIVKDFFQSNSQITILTKKPVEASTKEVRENPRARSAKLRAAVLLPS